MEKLNELLRLHGDEFRLPKSVATFKERNSLQLFSAEGIKNYAVCPSCHDLTSIKKKHVINEMVCNRSLVGAIYKPTNSREFCSGRIYDFENKSAGAQLVVQMVYSYCSIITTLKKLFLRKGFADKVKSWKTRQPARDYLSDLYDATGFLDFKTSPDAPSFVMQSDYNLLLSLNIDWFSPFNTNHSVGCIYLTVQNLPKQQGRDLKHNMLLVGVIPGPREPPTTTINKYLAPMVEELKVLLEGVQMKMIMLDGSIQRQIVKACLYSVCSDIPATKKLAGSMSFNSSHGCHLCKTKFAMFPNTVSRRNYCNWNCEQWERRTAEERVCRREREERLQERGSE